MQDFSLTKLTHERVVPNNGEERAHGGGRMDKLDCYTE